MIENLTGDLPVMETMSLNRIIPPRQSSIFGEDRTARPAKIPGQKL